MLLSIIGYQESWVLLVLGGDMLNGVDDGARDLCSVCECNQMYRVAMSIVVMK